MPAADATERDPRVALQLYTIRQQLAADLTDALTAVADAGYDAVELVNPSRVGVELLHSVLDGVGLPAMGAHVAYEELDARFEGVLSDLALLGCEYLVVQQARVEDWVSEQSVRALARQLDAWARTAHAAGMRFAYHGYHPIESEFAPYETRTMYDLMVESTDPTLVEIQVDTYWVHRVGRDPAATLREYAGRVSTLHLKDVAPPEFVPPQDTPVGDGIVDWPAVFAQALGDGVRWLIVEQENDPANAVRDIGRSVDFVRRSLGSGVDAG